MGCQCYQIGGPFIAEDPDCPAHGTFAQQEQADTDRRIQALENEVAAWRERFPTHRFRPQDDCIALK